MGCTGSSQCCQWVGFSVWNTPTQTYLPACLPVYPLKSVYTYNSVVLFYVAFAWNWRHECRALLPLLLNRCWSWTFHDDLKISDFNSGSTPSALQKNLLLTSHFIGSMKMPLGESSFMVMTRIEPSLNLPLNLSVDWITWSTVMRTWSMKLMSNTWTSHGSVES